MMYERPPTTPFQNPPQNTTFPFQNNILMFQQHQDESLYDAWTRFKKLIHRVPYDGLNLWSLTQFFYDHDDRYTKIDINYAAGGNLRRLSAEKHGKPLKIMTNAINNSYDEPIGDMEDKENNPSPQSSPQVLPSIEVYTPPVTYSEEVDETIGIPMEEFLKKRKKFFFTDPRDGVRINPDGVARLYLMRRSLEVLRKFHWMILGGRFNQLSHVSSPLLSKTGEY
ncbi:hypothetical protein Tco_0701175 [Tanacetum coccineum]